MIRRMVVLGNEQAVLQEIALRGAPHTDHDDRADFLDLEALSADLANGRGVDLKAISKHAARVAEKRVIERVLQQTRWNRKEAAEQLQISYKALLYKMKEGGLNDDR
jgi:two-component system response regulator AtoC